MAGECYPLPVSSLFALRHSAVELYSPGFAAPEILVDIVQNVAALLRVVHFPNRDFVIVFLIVALRRTKTPIRYNFFHSLVVQ